MTEFRVIETHARRNTGIGRWSWDKGGTLWTLISLVVECVVGVVESGEVVGYWREAVESE